jgi:hypothetical protein
MNNECCNHNCNQGRDCPLRNKELTDEEINQIWLEFDARNTNNWFIAIAKAILRKAQEK